MKIVQILFDPEIPCYGVILNDNTIKQFSTFPTFRTFLLENISENETIVKQYEEDRKKYISEIEELKNNLSKRITELENEKDKNGKLNSKVVQLKHNLHSSNDELVKTTNSLKNVQVEKRSYREKLESRSKEFATHLQTLDQKVKELETRNQELEIKLKQKEIEKQELEEKLKENQQNIDGEIISRMAKRTGEVVEDQTIEEQPHKRMRVEENPTFNTLKSLLPFVQNEEKEYMDTIINKGEIPWSDREFLRVYARLNYRRKVAKTL